MTATPTVQQCDRDAAESVVSAANITTCDGYYEVDMDQAAEIIAAHREAATAPLIELLREAREDIEAAEDASYHPHIRKMCVAILAKIDKALG